MRIFADFAEDEGFEPSNGLTHYTLSKRAHSAAMRILPRRRTLSVAITMITPDPSYGVTVLNSPRAGMQQG